MAMLHATLVALVVGTRTGAADDGMSLAGHVAKSERAQGLYGIWAFSAASAELAPAFRQSPDRIGDPSG